VQALHPVAATRRSVDMRVICRTSSHLIAVFTDDEERLRTASVSIADFDWIRSFCQLFWERRPPEVSGTFINGARLPGPRAKEHLAAVFGDREEEVLSGQQVEALIRTGACQRCHADARAYGWGNRLSRSILGRLPGVSCPRNGGQVVRLSRQRKARLPKQLDRISDLRCGGAMEGDTLCLGTAKVNSDPGAYAETDDEFDRKLLLDIIDGIVLRRPKEIGEG
jgi:hypothetical protein